MNSLSDKCERKAYPHKLFPDVRLLSHVIAKKCVDEKMSVERSQSRTGNSIVRGILQVSVNTIIFLSYCISPLPTT